jgi:hypothetical protein
VETEVLIWNFQLSTVSDGIRMLRRHNHPDVIARTELIGQRPGEEPFPIVIEIGRPYLRRNDPEEWGCPVSLIPLYKKLHDAVGVDAFQALCLGASLVIDLLGGFKEKGGSLSVGKGEGEFPLEAYAFGLAIKEKNPV